MTRRARRLATAVALLVAALFVGRWTANFLAERWWAATISPAAVSAVTRWKLLGLALDGIAITTAACWFALQAVVVARAIASVQVARQVGNLQLRETIPTRLLLLGAVVTGILLGVVTGAGAREWRAPVALAWQGVTYGVHDPLMHEDVGVYVSRLPLWDVAHGFAVLLAVLGLCVVLMLYAGIGAIRREKSELVVHPYARRHVGLLMVVVAWVISVGYLLAPYHFLTTPGPPISPEGAMTRIRAAQLMAGVAIGVGLLSLLWIRRGRHALLAGAWSVMAIGALVERIVVPALTAQASAPAGSDIVLRKFDALAWGITLATATVPTDTIPPAAAIWDRAVMARFVAGNGGSLLAATQASLNTPRGMVPAWLVATSVRGDSSRVDILAIPDGQTVTSGPPVSLRPAGNPATRLAWHSVEQARLIPNGPAWRGVPTGVEIGGVFRRTLLAWARQAAGMLIQSSQERIDWHLDPAERAAALLPMASWLSPNIAMVRDQPLWVVQGLIPLDGFPLAQRAVWRGEISGGLVPGFVATMDPATGATQVYLDPGADSTAAAWARFSHGLVEPAADLPAELRRNLTYPGPLLETQLGVLESSEWALGRRPGRLDVAGSPERSMPAWNDPTQPVWQSAFQDPDRRTLTALVTAQRTGGAPSLRIARYNGAISASENAGELQQLWGRMLPLMHLRDSSGAAGDTVETGPVHWYLGSGPLAAWQNSYSIPAEGPPVLLWISTALGTTIGGGRSVADAWHSVMVGNAENLQAPATDEAATLRQARLWMFRADSALARGDLTAFGRAIEELRSVLKP